MVSARVAVHKKCYDVKPAFGEEAWLCDVCQAGDDNATPLCELCSNVGGALKKSDQGKWVHTLCCNWIPEVYVRDLGQGNSKVVESARQEALSFEVPIVHKQGGMHTVCLRTMCFCCSSLVCTSL